MIHKPQFSIKKSQNNIIILFLYYFVLSSVRFFFEVYALFKCFFCFVIFNVFIVLLFWRQISNVWTKNIVPEIQLTLSNESVLRTGEPYTCEYLTLLESFYKYTLSIQWYMPQNFWATFSMSAFSENSFKTAIFSRFLKVAIAKVIFINGVYNGGFLPEVSIVKRVSKKEWNGKDKVKVWSFVPMYT